MKAPLLSPVILACLLNLGGHAFAEKQNCPIILPEPDELAPAKIAEPRIDPDIFTNIPEPSAALLGTLGAFLLLRRRK
ncbi:hypothetical protein ACFSSA_10540 [Luteolibacter algae]|uniref:PEP-CTERM protein-sorting domain-containing protein n=1 Tax=Luteolibacter algae TaxID=454151 RepID=A0ABW5DAN8_9BACT